MKVKCNWYTRYSHQRIGPGTGGLGNKRTGGNHPNYSIINIGQNTKKSLGDLRRLALQVYEYYFYFMNISNDKLGRLHA